MTDRADGATTTPIDETLTDPIENDPAFHRTESKIAVAGHPIHAMLVAFPVALAASTLGADLFYWWTGDLFWARAALWASGAGFLLGVLAGIAGTVELLMVPGIRPAGAATGSPARPGQPQLRIGVPAGNTRRNIATRPAFGLTTTGRVAACSSGRSALLSE